jgi:hypothetical protein
MSQQCPTGSLQEGLWAAMEPARVLVVALATVPE